MMLAFAFALAAAPSPCPAGTTVVMQCPAKAKHVAVCAGPAKGSATFVQYRFGALASIIDKPELVYPATTTEGFKPFSFERQNLISGTATMLSFKNGDVQYEVFTQDGKDAGGGVVVKKGGKILTTVSCTGAYEENWDRVEGNFSGAKTAATATATTGGKEPTSGGAKPDPLAGKSMKEICSDDVLTLLKFKWDDLRGPDTFSKNCCVPGALGKDDDRCQIDWPSSDMPDCGYFDTVRNGIFARYGYVFKDARYQKMFSAESWYQPRSDFDASWMPKLASANATTLKVFACAKPASPAQCQSIGLKWSLRMQKETGQVDGSQQNDISELLTAQCKSNGWGEDMAACFEKGEPNCQRRMRFTDLNAAVDGVRAINDDAANSMFPEMP